MASFFALNEGKGDRIFRVILGLIGLALMFVGPKTLWGLFGAIPLLTGLFGTCPLYSALGISTRSTNAERTAART